MTEYQSQEYRRDNYEAFKKYLTQWDWQWHSSLTFQPDTSFSSARRQFNRWRLDILNEERLRLGIFYIVVHKRDHKHLHALMIGRNRNGKSLRDCSTQRWQAAWRPTSKIEEVVNNEGICDYIALHFLGFKSDWYEYDVYDRGLLDQEMIPQENGDFDFDYL